MNGAAADVRIASTVIVVITERYFVAGRNRIALDFTSGIAPSGRAVTRYVDRDDGAQYIYSLFVPDGCQPGIPML